jgi:cytoskeletal protein RodZ
MEFLGEYLRKERERQNISIEDVAKSTRIKNCHIRAIEEERFESLPSPFYAKSFLRLYTKFLGLNPSDILNRFRPDQQDFIVKPPEVPPFLIPQRRRSLFSSFLSLLLAAFLSQLS